MKATISFCPDLTSPDAKSMDFGILTVEDDKFTSFEWTCDPSLEVPMNKFSAEVIKTTPDILRLEVDEGWAEWKDASSQRRNLHDNPRNALEYVAMCRRYSSIYVSRIET